VVKPCNPKRSPPFTETRHLAVQRATRAPCLPNPLSMSAKAFSMSPAAPGRRFGATVPGPRRAAIISIGTYGRLPMSPLRHPAKARAPRSLIVVSVQLVSRFAQARCRTRATVQKPFQRRGEVFAPPAPQRPQINTIPIPSSSARSRSVSAVIRYIRSEQTVWLQACLTRALAAFTVYS
jgi:hypothetical protein